MNNKRLRDNIRKLGTNKKLSYKEIFHYINSSTKYGANPNELTNALFDMWKDKEIYKVGFIFERSKVVWIWLMRDKPECKFFKNTNTRKNVEDSYNLGLRFFELGKCNKKDKWIIDNDKCVDCEQKEV